MTDDLKTRQIVVSNTKAKLRQRASHLLVGNSSFQSFIKRIDGLSNKF